MLIVRNIAKPRPSGALSSGRPVNPASQKPVLVLTDASLGLRLPRVLPRLPQPLRGRAHEAPTAVREPSDGTCQEPERAQWRTEMPRRSLVFCHRETRQCRGDLPPGLHRTRVPEDCHSRFAAMPRRHRPQSAVRNDGTARPAAVFCPLRLCEARRAAAVFCRRQRLRDVSTTVSRRACTCPPDRAT
jgi:hypothetical protein